MTDSIDRMYAYIAADETGEGIAAHYSPTMGWMPLVGADMARMESLRPVAQMLADESGQRIVLAHFEDRRDIEILEPGSAQGRAIIIKPEEADQ